MTLPMETRSDEETGISSVTVDIPVNAGAAFTWDVIRDIYAVDTRLIPGFAVTVEQGPDSRIVTFANGMRATERIVELDDDARRLPRSGWSAVSPYACVRQSHDGAAELN
ncbi:hypothetical protein PV367_02395 [Streptomyces europaeiscabiei]|uniref:Uncharacterized protein n=1 Tax=Streptomyces europaeiscabiei TaxID=146819 RepID=A0AAJ2PJH0_9ACTN|nr:hypothetical protein [Streptomyces europaeiscabiei]MDX3128673.1 hypothetical protein [Streptomyces europaeiscabiei]